MKIAITSTGPALSDSVDPRFGRAAYILIVDSETLNLQVIDNLKNVQAFKGAGIQAATIVSKEGADVLLTGYCGPNAFKTLKAGGVKVVNDVNGTVMEVLQAFKRKELVYSEEPNVEAHW